MTIRKDVKGLAYELTLEYVKQNNLLQCDDKEKLSEKIDTIIEISSIIYDRLDSKSSRIKFL